MKTAGALALAVVSVMSGDPALAAGTCSIATNSVTFGIVNPTLRTPFFGTGTLNVTCTSGTQWVASAGQGLNVLLTGGSWVRQMKGQTRPAPSYMIYHLYTDAAYTQLWSADPGPVFSGTGTGGLQSQTIRGAIQSFQQHTPPDTYKDTVQITLGF